MKNVLITIAAIIGICLFAVCCVMSSKNGAIGLEETVKTAKAAIDGQLTARFNKFHELAECVRKYDEHEASTLINVINGRGQNIGGKEARNLLAKFTSLTENYPALKSQENYQRLMDEISITENKLTRAREAYNSSVRDYNYYCRKFPTSVFLSFVGYE